MPAKGTPGLMEESMAGGARGAGGAAASACDLTADSATAAACTPGCAAAAATAAAGAGACCGRMAGCSCSGPAAGAWAATRSGGGCGDGCGVCLAAAACTSCCTSSASRSLEAASGCPPGAGCSLVAEIGCAFAAPLPPLPRSCSVLSSSAASSASWEESFLPRVPVALLRQAATAAKQQSSSERGWSWKPHRSKAGRCVMVSFV